MYAITRTNIPKEASGIYQIQSKFNGNVYVGSAINFRGRKYGHFTDLKNKKHGNQHLQNHYNKYGKADFQFSILEFCEKEKLIEREQLYIDTLRPIFNICQIAGSSLGIKYSGESKQKMRKAQLGKHHSEESKQKMSIAKIGKISPMFGKYHSEETKLKMCEARIGKYEGKNHPNYGKHLSEETKQKISKANKGNTCSEETRQKISKAKMGKNHPMFGKHFSKEHKLKLSAALKKAWEKRWHFDNCPKAVINGN